MISCPVGNVTASYTDHHVVNAAMTGGLLTPRVCRQLRELLMADQGQASALMAMSRTKKSWTATMTAVLFIVATSMLAFVASANADTVGVRPIKLTGVPISLTVTDGPPSPAPTDLRAVGINGEIQLTWNDNSLNETAWLIYDGTSASPPSQTVDGGTVGDVSYTWTGAPVAQQKCFTVRAYNEWGSSSSTNEACANAFPQASKAVEPSDVQMSWCDGPVANIIWQESSDWDSFKIYKNEGAIKELRQGDPDLQLSGSQYYYTVPAPINNTRLGVSAVKLGIESVIVYGDNGHAYSCPGA
jgi:hypothetical protein